MWCLRVWRNHEEAARGGDKQREAKRRREAEGRRERERRRGEKKGVPPVAAVVVDFTG
ncbi:hypothetical protein F2Q70_00016695 [Brassica cretica]|uniref:Uncharacterized protein n=1 Tax=Brassica cretica TaxID=69181 RepID=A0A8S9KW71_BRACR|nr:hypothetical protein F2Q70_00016695 [Brassica cretica]KAF2597573.1 hypothetical protein F2Q68_00009675 [Brassica cretica]